MSGEFLEVLKQVGPLSAIAVFLVWRLATGFDSVDARLSSVADRLTVQSDRLTAMEQAHQAIRDFQAQSAITGERTLWVIRQLCVQTANDAEGRRRCLSNPQD